MIKRTSSTKISRTKANTNIIPQTVKTPEIKSVIPWASKTKPIAAIPRITQSRTKKLPLFSIIFYLT